jgi:alkanesulfonate monooxygenase SsuD/methylene tetrahydromethanopterin reductase-like flavin-dependent oxidoreductase (luciferase family)
MQPILRNVFVAETDRQAVEIFGPAVQDHFDWYREEGQADATENPEEFELRFSELREERFVIGSPETVADDIVRLHDALGIDCVVASIHRPGIAHEHVREAIRLMGEAVIPEVRARTGA